MKYLKSVIYLTIHSIFSVGLSKEDRLTNRKYYKRIVNEFGLNYNCMSSLCNGVSADVEYVCQIHYNIMTEIRNGVKN